MLSTAETNGKKNRYRKEKRKKPWSKDRSLSPNDYSNQVRKYSCSLSEPNSDSKTNTSMVGIVEQQNEGVTSTLEFCSQKGLQFVPNCKGIIKPVARRSLTSEESSENSSQVNNSNPNRNIGGLQTPQAGNAAEGSSVSMEHDTLSEYTSSILRLTDLCADDKSSDRGVWPNTNYKVNRRECLTPPSGTSLLSSWGTLQFLCGPSFQSAPSLKSSLKYQENEGRYSGYLNKEWNESLSDCQDISFPEEEEKITLRRISTYSSDKENDDLGSEISSSVNVLWSAKDTENHPETSRVQGDNTEGQVLEDHTVVLSAT